VELMRAAIIVLIGLALTVSASAQSLAVVAAKETARRAALTKPSKVYTNSDVKPDLSAPPAPPTTDTAPKEPAAEKIAGKDEAFWKNRMRAIKAQLADDNIHLGAAVTQYELMASVLDNSSGLRRSVALGDRNRAMNQMLQWQATVAAGIRAVNDLEEEARQAGVPPGWLRW
jgi:hypothetical protein